MPQKPAALRHAEAVRPLDGRLAVRQAQRIASRGVVTEERDQVAHRREAEALHDRPLGLADQFVEVARPEAARDAAANLASVPGTPCRVVGTACRSSDHWPRGMTTRRSVSRCRQVSTPSASPFAVGRVAAVALAARQRQRVGGRVGHHLVADEAADRLAVVRGDRGAEQEPAVAGQQFADPAAPDDRVAAAEQEAVAGVGSRRRVVAAGGAVEHAQRQLVAAVVDVVEDGAVALGGVFRREEEDVRLELDLAFRVARRQVQIDDGLVARVLRIDGEAGDADELLVGAGVAERLAAGERFTAVDFEGFQLAVKWRRGQQHDEQRQPSTAKHDAPPVGGELRGISAHRCTHGCAYGVGAGALRGAAHGVSGPHRLAAHNVPNELRATRVSEPEASATV